MSGTQEYSMLMRIVAAGSELITTPFPCCVLPNFIQDRDGFLDSLKDEILRQKYYEKDNDLYQFHQVCIHCVLIL